MILSSTHNDHLRNALTIALLVASLVVVGCRPKDKEEQEDTASNSWQIKYKKAPLAEGQSSMLDSQVSSELQWQSWHKDLFLQADNERRIVCALIGSGTDNKMLGVLRDINRSPLLMKMMRNNHINAIIDSNLHPDMAHYTALLSIDSKVPVNTPMLVWFSYEGSPISWSPLQLKSDEAIGQLIRRMSSTVQSMWMESPDYTLQNSRDSFMERSKRIFPSISVPQTDKIRSLAAPIMHAKSLYDSISNAIDDIYSLTRARYLTLMVRASRLPELSALQQQQCLQVAEKVADKMLIHGLIDPLDGGVFDGSQGITHQLPRFSKTLRTQAKSMEALFQLYQATGNPVYLKAAYAIRNYTEKYHLMEDGGYALGISYLHDDPQDQPCLWTMEAIKAALTPNELTLATHAFGLSELGNIPLMDDPRKRHYQQNSLTWKFTLAELSERTSTAPDKLTQSLDSITKKLEASRAQKPVKATIEKLSTADSMALYASACVSGYRATGDTSYLDAATKILTRIRDHFINDEGQLQRARYNNKLNGVAARGFDYTLVCQAALDLHEAILDPSWLKFAHNIHTQMHARLTEPETGFIMDHDGSDYPMNYPVVSYYTLRAMDNDCTLALAHSNAKRLALRIADDSHSQQTDQLEGIMYEIALRSALSSIDYLTCESMARSTNVYLKLPVSEPLLAIARKSPCQIIAVTDSGSYPQLGKLASTMKPGTCTVIVAGRTVGSASSPDELKNLLTR